MNIPTNGGALWPDAAVAGIFLFFIIWKGRRGLSRSLLPLAVTVASLLGAAFFSKALAPAAAGLLLPALQRWFDGHADLAALAELRLPDLGGALAEVLPEGLRALLERFGLSVQRAAEEAVGAAAGSVETAVDALLRSVAETLAHIALFLVIFLLLLLLLNLLRRALGWAFRLPVIRWADVLGGALLGAVECAVVLWIVCAVAGLFDGGRLRALAEGTHLLSIFA